MGLTDEERKARKAAAYKARYEANREKEAARKKAYRESNREKVLAREKAYREANPEKKAAANKAWYEANREKRAVYRKAYYEANREKALARDKAWREANPEKKAARMKAWYEANSNTDKRRAKSLKEAYGITVEDKRRMWEAQNRACGVCERQLELFSDTGKSHGLVACIDHAHDSGRIRGLLCSFCNTKAVPTVEQGLAEKAKAYLNAHQLNLFMETIGLQPPGLPAKPPGLPPGTPVFAGTTPDGGCALLWEQPKTDDEDAAAE